MTEVTTDYLNGLGLSGYASGSSDYSGKSQDELGQEDFLNLVITQLTRQDPTNPVDNADFVAQMAQFSTLTGIQDLTSSFEVLANTLLQGQALQGASLVGDEVLVPAESVKLDEGEGASGAVSLTAGVQNAKVEVYDESGQLVRTLDMGSLSAGLNDFEWDGNDESGEPAPAGTYSFKVTCQVDGATQALSTLLDAEVQSVFTDSVDGSLRLSLKGMGDVELSDVLRIG